MDALLSCCLSPPVGPDGPYLPTYIPMYYLLLYSGDVFLAGEVVRVEWVAPQDSSYFDVFLLNDGNPVSLRD